MCLVPIIGASVSSDDIVISSWTLSRYRDPQKVYDSSHSLQPPASHVGCTQASPCLFLAYLFPFTHWTVLQCGSHPSLPPVLPPTPRLSRSGTEVSETWHLCRLAIWWSVAGWVQRYALRRVEVLAEMLDALQIVHWQKSFLIPI